MPDEQRRKIALFTNVEERAVISAVDSDDIYKIPMLLHEQDLDDIVSTSFGCMRPHGSVRVARRGRCQTESGSRVDIGMVGKYMKIRDSYISLNEALMHGGIKTRTRVNIHYFESSDIERARPRRVARDGRHPRAGRLWRSRHRGQDPGDPLCAREWHSLFGYLLGHAAGHH